MDQVMNLRWLWVVVCLFASLVLLGGGLLVPAHLKATDSGIVWQAGRGSPTLLEHGRSLVEAGQLGTAQMFVAAARVAQIPGWDRLGQQVTNAVRQHPAALFWGADARTEQIFDSPPAKTLAETSAESFAAFIIRRENRQTALAYLSGSASPSARELLSTRALNNTTLFTPSASASGQAFDAAVAEGGLLLDGKHLTAGLDDAILALASQANHGDSSGPLEQVLMDLTSLGERLNWDQLTAFTAAIPDVMVLHQLADEARNADARGGGDDLPVLFAAVQLSGDPAAVARYAVHAGGLKDLAASLRYGQGGIGELAESGRPLYRPAWLQAVTQYNPFGSFYDWAAAGSLKVPSLMLAVKWLAYLAAGFFLALALHFARPVPPPLERPLQVPGVHLLREFLFSLGFLLLVLLLSEPFLAREDAGETFALRPHLPMAGGAVAAGIAGLKQTVMNPTILLTLLLFLVLQALLYLACLVKLAEIRRQAVPPRMKLKLLENEDHLFDAGLYLGFVGTILSLIVASMGLVKFSLMAAYSSTSFGIIFVCIFKIFHLRPARRQLLLEAEAAETYAAAGTPVSTLPS
jgi:hypothetical protein